MVVSHIDVEADMSRLVRESDWLILTGIQSLLHIKISTQWQQTAEVEHAGSRAPHLQVLLGYFALVMCIFQWRNTLNER